MYSQPGEEDMACRAIWGRAWECREQAVSVKLIFVVTKRRGDPWLLQEDVTACLNNVDDCREAKLLD